MDVPAAKAPLLEGKRGLIVGIANERSIAWCCARACHARGAELAVTYVNEKTRKYVEPLARMIDAAIVMPLNVDDPGQMDAAFQRLARDWGGLHFFCHSIPAAAHAT